MPSTATLHQQELGDLVLTAEAVTAARLKGMARLLEAGDRATLPWSGSSVVHVERRRSAPRRVTHVQRFPDAERMVFALGEERLWFVVLPPVEDCGAAPTAFQIAPGRMVCFERGVWHAGPFPVGETQVGEILEASRSYDRLDRQTIEHLGGPAALRIALPDEAEAPEPVPFSLEANDALRVAPTLSGLVRLGALEVEACDLAGGGPALGAHLTRAARGLRTLWADARTVTDIPGLSATKALLATLVGPEDPPWPGFAAFQDLLRGQLPAPESPADALWALLTLRMRVPVLLFDADRIAGPILVRRGESARGGGGVYLHDRRGPIASAATVMGRARPGASTRRLLLVSWVAADAPELGAGALLDGAGIVLVDQLAGRLVARRLVP